MRLQKLIEEAQTIEANLLHQKRRGNEQTYVLFLRR